MKQFFKSVAATVVGIFAFGIIMGIFTFISLIGMLMSGDKPSLRDNSVMVMKLQGTINEQGQEDVMGQITGNSFNQLGLNEILSAIKKAKNEDKIKGIYLEPGALITARNDAFSGVSVSGLHSIERSHPGMKVRFLRRMFPSFSSSSTGASVGVPPPR